MNSKHSSRINTRTEKKQIDQAYFEERLSAVIEEQNQFIRMVSHDLQTPLRAVSGFTTLLKEQHMDGLDDEGRMYVDCAYDGALQLKQMLDDLVTLSRINSTMEPFTSVDCKLVIEQVSLNLKNSNSKDIEIFADKLPIIEADKDQITMLFRHLLTNALIFNEQDSLIITIRAKERDQCYEFSIRDNSIGIKERYWQRIFDPFYQMEPELNPESSGMGLPICRAIVKKHKGDIQVLSSSDAGTEILFTIGKTDS